jgi:hypothetical protein
MQPASGHQLGKHDPTAIYTDATIEKRRFLYDPCRDVKARTVGGMIKLSSAREAGRDGHVIKSNEFSCEALASGQRHDRRS